ncbi:hypothetical protein GCM10027418_25400 [Mariniluteicoccus endophyticus]
MADTIVPVRRLAAVLLASSLAVGMTACEVEQSPKGPTTPRVTRQSEKIANLRFIQSIAPYAQEGERTHGVPTSIAMGQAILESGWGRSGLTVWGGAYFGIKCSKVTSKFQMDCVAQSSLEYDASASPRAEVSSFRTYASPRDSFADHGQFLRDNPRYADAFTTKDPREFVVRIHRAGYATDPGYPDLVMQLVDTYDLTQYDLSTPSPTPSPAPGQAKVDGPIGQRWAEMGGATSPLGGPVGGEQDGPADTTLVVFEKGIMLWTREHGAFPLTGPTWMLYRNDPKLRERLGAPKASGSEADGATRLVFDNGAIVERQGKATAQ